ncbi:pre-rRNA-processing protein esf1 [Trifolium pratense]|uniref:pre-rRNA-processing protein esf1 n=1 Tax=Trifolium pratense TaxID=57577 RepID=UPI001E69542E|nr:pre-rRNA-processing protein esf1 [Trifolium pratense]
MGSKNSNKKKHNDDNGKKKNKKLKVKNNNGKSKQKDNKSSSNSNDKIIDDPRFSTVHTDPRFREAPKHQTKVAIDSRFNRMFTHKSFSSSSAPVDKRGRPKDKANSQQHSLRHYYKIDEEEEDKMIGKKKKKVEQSSDEDTGEEDEEGLVEVDNAKPEVDSGIEESEEGSESEHDAIDSDADKSADTGTDTDSDEGVDEEDYEEDEPEMQEEIVEIEKETHRLAVVNMDWRYVKAVDLYVLFSSLAPPSGLIKSVTIYPTEFGIQRMTEEEVKGPVGYFDGENETTDEEENNDSDADNEKLRAYEKSRMRYYFALVECDSSATADHIYKENDGVEFEHSSNPLDLRFIPDDMEIKQPPKDVASEIPANYENKDFYSRALQHSKVELTWDEDEPLRANILKRKFNDEQLAQLEMNELMASDESESDDSEDNNETDDRANKKAKYLSLLNNNSDEDDEDNDVQDMEVTFNTGLEDISKHIMEKKDKESRTYWEECLRKKREKKKARKNKSKYSSSSDDDDINNTDQETTKDVDDFFIDEEPDTKKKKTKSKNDKDHKLEDMDGVDQVSKEELELLLADDKGTDTGLKGYNLKFKKGKGKKMESAVDEGKIPNSAFDDPRFASIFSSDFAIDPTDPQFKRSAVYARQLAQKQQKGRVELSTEKEQVKFPSRTQLSSDGSGVVQKGEEEGLDDLKSKKDKFELSSMVKSIKMKSKQIQLSSDGKTKKDGKSQFRGKEKRRH